MSAPGAERLREGEAEDVPAVAALMACCLAEAWSPAALAETLASPGVGLLVAQPEDEAPPTSAPGEEDEPPPRGPPRPRPGLSAAALLRVEAEDAELLQLSVAPSHRRRGLARRLLARVEAQAIRQGARRMLLEVRVGNRAARQLYLGAGYQEVGRRRAYYRDGEDGLVLERALGPPPPRSPSGTRQSDGPDSVA